MSSLEVPQPACRDREWWSDHFSGSMLALWQAIVPPEQALEDAGFLLTHAGLKTGDRVLDVPCGEGRMAIELATRGLRVLGVDISAGQIEAARRQAIARNLDLEWHLADMRDLPWQAAFDAGYCWGDSFGYMDDAGNRAFLAAVHRALVPGGRWAMEMQMLAELLPRLQRRASGRAGEFQVEVRRRYDAQSGRLSVEYRLERDRIRETHRAWYRIHTLDELRALLETADFRVDRLCARDGSPFSDQADRLRVVCTALPEIRLSHHASCAGGRMDWRSQAGLACEPDSMRLPAWHALRRPAHAARRAVRRALNRRQAPRRRRISSR